jgi:N-acetylglutamate synthase-like GNAT family acetyltransferase
VHCIVLKKLFGDPFTDLEREHKPIPLQRKGDINYEVEWQTADVEKEGHKVIHVDQTRHGETVMIYRLHHYDYNELEDQPIHLRIKIISSKGVKSPDSNAHLSFYHTNKLMRISDIKIKSERVSRGYGSILMAAIMQLVDQLQVRYITGWISSADWDHIDRSEYFYRKHGFDVELNHEVQSGKITWVNQALGAVMN